jgi:chemotaxis protein CheD
MAEISVRMGELATSSDPGTPLVSIGLGSCIGLALVDSAAGVAGLAHVMLPGPAGEAASKRPAGTFADTGVPALLEAVLAAGARRMCLSAVLVGGAQMFGGAGKMQVGQRNEEAVRAALRAVRIPIARAETGGGNGRTIRVYLDDGVRVTSRAAGGSEEILYGTGALAVAA